MIIVTGGAGFIGSNLVKGLNDQSRDDILVVDNLTNADKVNNLSDLKIADYMDKAEFRQWIEQGGDLGQVEAIFHQGACSDTMATDGKYVMDNNFSYSKSIYHYCRQNQSRFIYASSASVYGSGTEFIEEPAFESTLNAYAYSKLLFDNFIRRQKDIDFQCVGLRYFNVYGVREQHKQRMASVAWHFYNQFRDNGAVRLFEGTEGYEDGQQLRDFISVDDVVKVNLFLLENPQVSGIFNVGTGACQSFNDVAVAVINSVLKHRGETTKLLNEIIEQGLLTYVPMPEALHGKYQSYTQADLNKLRKAGYVADFDNVDQGVGRYIDSLINE